MKPNPKGYYIHDAGGLGDVQMDYFTGARGWGYLASFKKKWPNLYVKVMLTTANPQAKELIRYNPHIDDIEEYEWYTPHHPWPLLAEKAGGCSSLAAFGETLEKTGSKLEFVAPVLWTSEQDNEDIANVVGSGRYIFIHPFAGDQFRMPLGQDDYIAVVDRLIDELGYNVVVVGATYQRVATVLNETFEYQRGGLFNLVDKTNARVAFSLARKSTGFIGTWSCFVYPALLGTAKTVVTWPADKKMPGHRYYPKNEPDHISVMVTEDHSVAIDRIIKHFRND